MSAPRPLWLTGTWRRERGRQYSGEYRHPPGSSVISSHIAGRRSKGSQPTVGARGPSELVRELAAFAPGATTEVQRRMHEAIQAASGIRTGNMSFGKVVGDAIDTNIAQTVRRNSADGPCDHQEWLGMNPTTPILSGGMNALRIQGVPDNLGNLNLILTAGGGSYKHVDGPAANTEWHRQAERCWKDGAIPVEFAKQHRELARAFESFPHGAERPYPKWRQKLPEVA